MRTILKKDILNPKSKKIVKEFVAKSGDLIDSIEQPEQTDKIYTSKGQTTDDKVKQTRQPNQFNNLFNFAYNYGVNYSGIREDSSLEMIDPEFTKTLPSSVISNLDNLIDSIKDVQMDSEGKNNVLKYIHNSFLDNGQ